MQLTGIHHLTAVTAQASRNHNFYTQTLGLRLVKRSVNQDDVSAYHLFYADGLATPGTDITFFDWPTAPEQRGTRSIVRTALRVPTEGDLHWWASRLRSLGVTTGEVHEQGGTATLEFQDFEGQRLALVVDGPNATPHPWVKSPVPAEHQIRGLGPITLSVPKLEPTDAVLTGVMNMRRDRTHAGPGGTETHVYAMGDGGPAAELHVAVEPNLPVARSGAGGVHHVAFRTPTFEQYDAWIARLAELRVPSSGAVDRYYFRSLYFREPNGILFEIATDGPGFDSDEPMDQLGERLALPPFLEGRRAQIEAGLKPL